MSSSARTHIVFVPGFFGFDALGQVAYYAGVTSAFNTWRRGREGAVLHYFDTFPTASVEIRARHLRAYLAKRIARGEIARDDRLAFVGHSTGGLDIRRALFDLERDEQSGDRILERTARIAFLSVPHYGTNLADFACSIEDVCKALFNGAARGVMLNRPPITDVRRFVSRAAPKTSCDLLRAIADALNESDEHVSSPKAQRADEREARSQWALWLEHMSQDFQIVHDLRSATGPIGESASPAHFSPSQRRQELASFSARGITTRSYATRMPAGAVDEPSAAIRWAIGALKGAAPVLQGGARMLNEGATLWQAPPVSLLALFTRGVVSTPVLLGILGLMHADPSFVVTLFHALCADPSGPFRHPDTLAAGSIAPQVERFSTRERIATEQIGVKASDGVINTLSMLWPYDADAPDAHPIFLVDCDHGDITGHFRLEEIPGAGPDGRRYEAYDFFQSRLAFDAQDFRAVWEDVFTFCAGDALLSPAS